MTESSEIKRRSRGKTDRGFLVGQIVNTPTKGYWIVVGNCRRQYLTTSNFVSEDGWYCTASARPATDEECAPQRAIAQQDEQRRQDDRARKDELFRATGFQD